MYSKSSIESSCSNPWHYLIAIRAMVRKGSAPKARNGIYRWMQISNSFNCRRMSDLSLVSARANQCWRQTRLQSHPGSKRARKQMQGVQRTCFRFWPLWMSHAASYKSCRIFMPLYSPTIVRYIYIYIVRRTVQQIEWDCEAGLDRDKLRVFSLYSHKTNFCPCCPSIREIVHGIDLITCSKRTRIALDIRLARNIFMQKGSCSFTWANELVFLFAVPAEWCTI